MKRPWIIIILLNCISYLALAQGHIDSRCTDYINFATQVALKKHQVPYKNNEFVVNLAQSDYAPARIITWTLACSVFVDFENGASGQVVEELAAYAPNPEEGWLESLYLFWYSDDNVEDVFGSNLSKWKSRQKNASDADILKENEVSKRPDIVNILKSYLDKGWNPGVLYQLDNKSDHVEMYITAIPEDPKMEKYFRSDRCFMKSGQPNILYCSGRDNPTEKTTTIEVYFIEIYS